MSTSRTQSKQPRDILHTTKKELGGEQSPQNHLVHPATMITNAALQVTQHNHSNRETLIAELAYHFAEQRGFESGHELEDWLAAEAQVDSQLLGEGRVY